MKGKKQNFFKKWDKMTMLTGGMLTGFFGGFFGGGGGMLAVPLLNKVLGVETKCAHATAMLIILPMSIASAAMYMYKDIFDLGVTLITGAAVLAGGTLGATLLKKLNSFIVAILFALMMIIAGVRLTFF